MGEQPRLVSAETEQPLRAAGLFVLVTFLIATAVYLPLLATDLGWLSMSLPPGLQIVGILSPGIATLLIRLYEGGMAGIRSAFGGLTAWQFGRRWWSITLGLPPVFAAVLAGGAIALGQDFSPEPMRFLAEVGPGIVLLVLVSILLSNDSSPSISEQRVTSNTSCGSGFSSVWSMASIYTLAPSGRGTGGVTGCLREELPSDGGSTVLSRLPA